MNNMRCVSGWMNELNENVITMEAEKGLNFDCDRDQGRGASVGV